MSTPNDVVAQQLAEGLDVAGTVSAGIFGDQAGASAPPVEMDLSKATATSADVAALQKRLAQLEAAQAAVDAPPPPEVVDTRPVLANTSSEVTAAFDGIHERLLAVEAKLGL